MLKREITYKDLDEVEVTETFYFNLTKTEILDMEVEHGDGGLDAWYRRIVKTEDHKALIKEFKEIILKAYGQRDPEGKRFIKSDELRTAFSQSMAYDQLFFELATDDSKAAEFLMGILPADVREEAEKLEKEKPLTPPNIRPAEDIRAEKEAARSASMAIATENVELPQPPAPLSPPQPTEGNGVTLGRSDS